MYLYTMYIYLWILKVLAYMSETLTSTFLMIGSSALLILIQHLFVHSVGTRSNFEEARLEWLGTWHDVCWNGIILSSIMHWNLRSATNKKKNPKDQKQYLITRISYIIIYHLSEYHLSKLRYIKVRARCSGIVLHAG